MPFINKNNDDINKNEGQNKPHLVLLFIGAFILLIATLLSILIPRLINNTPINTYRFEISSAYISDSMSLNIDCSFDINKKDDKNNDVSLHLYSEINNVNVSLSNSKPKTYIYGLSDIGHNKMGIKFHIDQYKFANVKIETKVYEDNKVITPEYENIITYDEDGFVLTLDNNNGDIYLYSLNVTYTLENK